MTDHELALWTPSPARRAASNLLRFQQTAHREAGAPAATGEPTQDYHALWQWSVSHRAAFWATLRKQSGLMGDWGSGPVLQDADRMPGARWFADSRLNYAENLLSGEPHATVLLFADERGRRARYTRAELRQRVARVAAGLAGLGIGPGDVVAGFLPNVPEALIAMLATASLGAVWTSTSPGGG